MLAIGGPNARTGAEAQFQEALELARRHQARAWELRAALSLARLWSGTDRMADGHQLLSAVYDSFTEGFETADLRSARSLLQQLH
jgi:predicted ATPase